jgi:putative transposase
MRAKLVAYVLVDKRVVKSRSRPHTSDDNPCPEALLKTLKCRPEFPVRFDSLADARVFCPGAAWHNDEHRHSGIGYITLAAMHTGVASVIYAQRNLVLEQAFARHTNRFKHRCLQPRSCQRRLESTCQNLPQQTTAQPELHSKLSTKTVSNSLGSSGTPEAPG